MVAFTVDHMLFNSILHGFQNYDNFTGKGDCYVDNDLNRAVNFDTTLSDSKLIKGENNISVGK